MRAAGLAPSAVTYGCLLAACERGGDVERAFALYKQACDEVGCLPFIWFALCPCSMHELGRASRSASRPVIWAAFKTVQDTHVAATWCPIMAPWLPPACWPSLAGRGAV